MNKDLLLKMLNTKEGRKKELRCKAEKTEEIAELRSINKELDGINEDIEQLRNMIKAIENEEREEVQNKNEEELEKREQENIEEKRNALPVGGFNPLATYTKPDEERAEIEKKYEQRGQTLKDGKAVKFSTDEMPTFRAVSLGSGKLVNEDKYSRDINKTFNEVSGLIDKVHAVPLQGGESYSKAFEKSSGEGDYTTEDGEYHDADPEFDYVSIGKAKITAYTEITDEAKKLPNIQYQTLVRNSIEKSLRKKITKQIVLGAGGSNAITGIFNAPAKVIPSGDGEEVEISEIDKDTLDKIVFGYGGDEDVEGDAYLILNKLDLAKFAAIRGTDDKKLYKIELNGNTGTISSDDSFKVPFIINSGCPALSSTKTAADTLCMAYGKLEGYEMPVFSDIEVEESRDYKFKTGQIAYRGSVWIGGNVAMYKGFVRVKKITA
ncbi:phage major capsid protein [Vallitalea guaymasensis]|uniref:phage major capsid protein n=1 Tax=Vallitalea guaymasensis TaxID=1185412 RepID=UPI0023561179|nr:phage major capsid protein [Vallitalea guaymasensis]